MADHLYPDLEGPAYLCPLEVGDTVSVTGTLSTHNDVGGTLVIDDAGGKECTVTKAFWDYEAGWRFIGKLVDQVDVEAMRVLATTGHTAQEYRDKYPGQPHLAESTEKALAEFDPSRVYFSEHDIPQPTIKP